MATSKKGNFMSEMAKFGRLFARDKPDMDKRFLTPEQRNQLLIEMSEEKALSDAFDKAMMTTPAAASTSTVPAMDEFDAEKMKKVIAEIMAAEVKPVTPGSFAREYMTNPTPPRRREVELKTTVESCWEAENNATGPEIDALIVNHPHEYARGRNVARKAFEDAKTNGRVIDEDGTGIVIEHMPWSPFTDEGAAFCIGVVYHWREYSEDWHEREKHLEGVRMAVLKSRAEDLERAEKEKQRQAMEKETVTLSKHMLNYGTGIIRMPESSGIAKIAGAIAGGELDKLKRD